MTWKQCIPGITQVDYYKFMSGLLQTYDWFITKLSVDSDYHKTIYLVYTRYMIGPNSNVTGSELTHKV